VGGALRSLAIGKAPTDFDFATSARPEQVRKLFRRVILTGIDHGTVTVLFGDESFEVTTFRAERGYSDARHPDSVEFVSDLYQDLERRDFTMNALAMDPETGELVDPHGGLDDLRADIVRAIGDPAQRFSEDALRILRALRFATQLGFVIAEETFSSMKTHVASLSAISLERIRDELTKLLLADTPSHGLKLMRECAALPFVLPELIPTVGFVQGGQHRFPLFEHLLLACDSAPPVLHLRLAALLHDIGKPDAAMAIDGEILHFHGHDASGAKKARAALSRLHYPNKTIDSVEHLIRHHMFGYTPEWSDAAVRRFISRIGADSVNDLLSLRVADSRAVAGTTPRVVELKELEKRILKELEAENALQVRDLTLSGNDLIAAGIPAGPLLGVVLRELLDTVLDDPQQNTPEALLPIALKLYEKISD
jgi:tRNA nucleotidyltransferase/poly(A) polymerase